jgi:hypothetical protein
MAVEHHPGMRRSVVDEDVGASKHVDEERVRGLRLAVTVRATAQWRGRRNSHVAWTGSSSMPVAPAKSRLRPSSSAWEATVRGYGGIR